MKQTLSYNPLKKNDRYYPSRLIEIGDAIDDLVYLRERNEANFRGDYVALSHCWGKTPMTKLVRTQEQILETRSTDSLNASRSTTSSNNESSGPQEDQHASLSQEEVESQERSSPSRSIVRSDVDLTEYEQDSDQSSPEESTAEDFRSTASGSDISFDSSMGQDIQISREEFIAGFPSSKLPQTFQDAVAVTRRLQLKYVWIDSLCILQDSPEDWKYESAQMHHVYGNAFVTLAADASRDSSEGLFRDRFPSLVTPTRVTAAWKEAFSKDFIVIARRFWSESQAQVKSTKAVTDFRTQQYNLTVELMRLAESR
ncbi:hypothetical protein P7C71_g2828, partial [Lecanoromycetidae sp. Uapishka_2]